MGYAVNRLLLKVNFNVVSLKNDKKEETKDVHWTSQEKIDLAYISLFNLTYTNFQVKQLMFYTTHNHAYKS